MGRRLLYPEKMEGTFSDGTFARIDELLSQGEARTDFVRMAVEREIGARKKPDRRQKATSSSFRAPKLGQRSLSD